MRQCEVLVNGITAGLLTETDSPRGYLFEYNPDYLNRKESQGVCLAMPLRKEPYYSPHLFPFFFNMLSEGENRTIQATTLKIDRNDDFGILLATAEFDTIGAVTVRRLNHTTPDRT